MSIYEILAQLTYSIMDLIALEILISSIFIVRDGKIKFTVDYLFGKIFGKLSKYRKTSVFVYSFIILGVAYFYISNSIQSKVISLIAQTKWKTIPLFVFALSFCVFWATKVILGRKWNFQMVWVSLAVAIVSFILVLL